MTNLFLLKLCLVFLTVQVSKASEVATELSINPTIVVKSQDFRNTQTTKSCILAYLNMTLLLELHKNGKPTSIITHNLTEEDQSTVSTNGSYCEQDFKSLLVLNFRYSQMSILFEREEIKTNHKEASYCDGCADGKWNIPEVLIKVPDLNKLPGYMSNKTGEKLELVATASSNDFSDEAGTLKGKGVAVKRSYFCSNLITVPMKTQKLDEYEVTATLQLHAFKVQPFLVGKTEKFAHPQFCNVDRLSHLLIIFVPICYFAVFLIISKYNFKPNCKPRNARNHCEQMQSLQDNTEVC